MSWYCVLRKQKQCLKCFKATVQKVTQTFKQKLGFWLVARFWVYWLIMVYGLMVDSGPFIFTIVKSKNWLAITNNASYSLGSCPLIEVIAFPNIGT